MEAEDDDDNAGDNSGIGVTTVVAAADLRSI